MTYPYPHRTARVGVSLLSAMILCAVLCGFSYADEPVQQWLYALVESKSYNGGKPMFVVISNGRLRMKRVLLEDISNFDTLQYDFTNVADRDKFNFLKTCFGIDYITPGELGDLFGAYAKITYGYVYNACAKKVYSQKDAGDAIANGCLQQNSVTIQLTE